MSEQQGSFEEYLPPQSFAPVAQNLPTEAASAPAPPAAAPAARAPQSLAPVAQNLPYRGIHLRINSRDLLKEMSE